MVKKIYVKQIISDEKMKSMQGDWATNKHIKNNNLINFDADIYKKINGKDIIIAKFRKKALNENDCKIAWENFKDAAKASRGRGPAAGHIDINNTYWRKRTPIKTDKWSTSYIVNGKISKMKVNNQVASNVVGYYEGTPFMKLPARMTHYTRSNFDKFQNGLSVLQKLGKIYKKLTPKVYKNQNMRAGKRNHLRIPETPFSSITVNRNFRTALHTDAGNFNGGMAVMTALERGKYSGGYTVFPQYGIGFDVRHGDVLIMENCNTWHANTEIKESKSQRKYNESLKDIFNDNPEVGTAGLDKKYTRITIVCYLREKLLNEPNKTNKYILKYTLKKKNKKKNKTKKFIKSNKNYEY